MHRTAGLIPTILTRAPALHCALTHFADLSQGVVVHGIELMKSLLAMLVVGEKMVPVPSVPFFDVCRSAGCCVRKSSGAEFYSPWKSNVTVPEWWDPYLKWEDVLRLGFASGASAVALAFATFVLMQAVWLVKRVSPTAGGQGVPPKVARALMKLPLRLKSTKGGVADSADGEAGGQHETVQLTRVREQLQVAAKGLEMHFGKEYFQSAALDACLRQVEGFLDSRARRLQGYAAQDINTAEHAGDYRLDEAEKQALLNRVEHLDPPTDMPCHEVKAMWSDLTEGLRKWLVMANYRDCRLGAEDGGEDFTLICDALRKHGHELCLHVGQLQHPAQGQAGEGATVTEAHWRMLLLYLLMGANNVLRAAPECINFLFTVHACTAASAASAEAGDKFSFGEAIDADTRTALDNFRTSIYVLLQYGGGTLGNRIPAAMHEKYMNFDDLAELCSEPGARTLFAGLAQLRCVLRHDVAAMLLRGGELLRVLDNTQEGVETEPLHLSLSQLRKAISLCERIESRSANEQGRQHTRRLSVGGAVAMASSNPSNGLSAGNLLSIKAGGRQSRWSRAILQGGNLDRLRMIEMQEGLNLHSKSSNAITMEGEVNGVEGQGSPELRLMLLECTDQLLEQLRMHGLAEPIEAHVRSSLGQSSEGLEKARSKAVLRIVEALVANAKNEVQESGSSPQAKVMPSVPVKPESLSIHELSELRAKCVKMLQSVFNDHKSIGDVFISLSTCTARFTWGRDAHKTFCEKPGYDSLLLNMWFLFRFLINGLCATLFFTSGGLLALYWTNALRALPIHEVFDHVTLAFDVAKQTDAAIGNLLPRNILNQFEGSAPMLVAGFASLSIIQQMLSIAEDILWLGRGTLSSCVQTVLTSALLLSLQ